MRNEKKKKASGSRGLGKSKSKIFAKLQTLYHRDTVLKSLRLPELSRNLTSLFLGILTQLVPNNQSKLLYDSSTSNIQLQVSRDPSIGASKLPVPELPPFNR